MYTLPATDGDIIASSAKLGTKKIERDKSRIVHLYTLPTTDGDIIAGPTLQNWEWKGKN